MYDGFDNERLDESHVLFRGVLPPDLITGPALFDELWNQHPSDFAKIRMHGNWVATPRWQQAYGKDYHFTQQTSIALPVPPILAPFHDFARRAIDARLNGLLVIWYDGALGHYIGRHRDSTVKLIEGAPIVTISLGQERLFRLRPWRKAGMTDFPAADRSVFVLPYETNKAWTHEVPHRAADTGRRISITLRGFV
jgi:alkylated DNA repair dioxygenase AlkB